MFNKLIFHGSIFITILEDIYRALRGYIYIFNIMMRAHLEASKHFYTLRIKIR